MKSVKHTLHRLLDSFEETPPETEYQYGYLAGVIEVSRAAKVEPMRVGKAILILNKRKRPRNP